MHKYNIRCKDCGYECAAFHGWAFIKDKCKESMKPSMFHKWEKVDD